MLLLIIKRFHDLTLRITVHLEDWPHLLFSFQSTGSKFEFCKIQLRYSSTTFAWLSQFGWSVFLPG